VTEHRQPALVPARVVRGRRGAVASPHALATQAGLGALAAGGSAVDAAIAVNAALSVVCAYMCGLGGDAFWLIWDGARLQGLNGSGRSGAAATIENARAAGLDEIPVRGAWTVTVPGAIRSWGDAHARFGRLRWPDLLAPAIELARGFPATDAWSGAVESAVRAFGTDGDWARAFRAHDRAWRPGEIVRLPALATTLERIAAEGPDTAYEGHLGRRSAEYLGERGSPLRPDDFAAHQSDWTEPIRAEYRGAVAHSHRPNSSGPIALLTLNVLRRFDPPERLAWGGRGWSDARWIHLGLEASRLALAERDAELTDEGAMEASALDRLLGDELADELASRIDPDRAAAPAPAAGRAGGGTIYLATADAGGACVSLIESNYAGFGSGLVDPATGIGFQNRGAFFRLDPRHRNALAPRKRTMHTLTPGMLFRDGRPWIVHGAMGGEIQPQVFAQLVSAVVDGDADVATAVSAPRWGAVMPGHYEPPSLSVVEPRFDGAVVSALRERGQPVKLARPFDSGMGHEHAIELVNEGTETTFAAAADPRSEGQAGAL
jgi:gamma-glutamyltranspeptidase/glutathione hydrolase